LLKKADLNITEESSALRNISDERKMSLAVEPWINELTGDVTSLLPSLPRTKQVPEMFLDDLQRFTAPMPASPDGVSLDMHSLDAHDALFPMPEVFNFDLEMAGVYDSVRFFDIPSERKISLPASNMGISEAKPVVPSAASTKKHLKRSLSSESTTEDESGQREGVKIKKAKTPSRVPRSRMPTSTYRGVSRCTKDGRWQARIRVCKEVVYLGRFQTEEEAARRYDEAARLHHGKAAMLNFVTQEDLVFGRKSVFSAEKGALEDDEQ